MALRREDTDFRHPAISYLDYKQLDMDRVLTAFFARLQHNGLPSRLARSTDLTVDHYVQAMLDDPESFADFDRETTYRWVETYLLDLVNRGKPGQAVAGLRPLHGFTYRFRNTRRSRPYGADEQLYELIFHAPGGRGPLALQLLKAFFFAGVDTRTEAPEPGTAVDVETQALISLSNAVGHQIADRADTSRPRMSYPPLLPSAADLLVEDILRLFYHRDLMPRSVFVEYLKILLAFHLALYHLRLMKYLPALVRGTTEEPDSGFFLDVAGFPGSAPGRLAERSADLWYSRSAEFIRATFMVKKLDDLARYLVRRGKLRQPAGGRFMVADLLRLLGPATEADRTAFANARLSAILDGQAAGDDPDIDQILQLGLDDFTTYIEIIAAKRTPFHRKYLTDCIDSLLLKNRPGAMLTQPLRGERRFIADSRLLEVLLQISLLQPTAGVFRTAELRIDQLVDLLRKRYGLYVGELPTGDGFTRPGMTERAALRDNLAALTARLRQLGYYPDLSDAYVTQTITPRYTVSPSGAVQ
jgi:hypothetical protein